MFEKEAYPEDFSSIDINAYSSPKGDKHCQLPCNSIALFIVVGFLFIFMGIAGLISNYQANSVTIPLTRQGNVLTNSQKTYVSFQEADNVGLYLHIQNLSQFSYKYSQKYQEIEQNTLKGQGCYEYRLNKQLRKTTAIDGTVLNPADQAIPCGFYEGMFPVAAVALTSTEANLTLSLADLTYFTYDLYNVDRSRQWVDLEDQTFHSWLQQNAEIGTMKLIGHLPASLSGLVQVTITMQNELPTGLGEVSVILASNKAFGNKNLSFCLVNFFQSCCLFMFSFAIFFYNKLIDREVEESNITLQEVELKSVLEPQSGKSNMSE